MIPLGDDNPTQSRPYVVYGLIALNVFVYVANFLGRGFLDNWSAIPYSVLHNVRVVPVFNQAGQALGFMKDPAFGPHPQWITVFTSMFMHGGLLHIGGNMLYLWIFGNNIEDVLGHVKFLIFYLLCGIIAASAHIFFNAGSFVPMVGASGAIAGVLGAYILLYPRASIHTLVPIFFFMTLMEVPAVYVLGVWFLYQLLGLGSSGGLHGGGVAYWAHVGGFAAGIVIILLLGGKGLVRRRQRYDLLPPDDRPYPFRPAR